MYYLHYPNVINKSIYSYFPLCLMKGWIWICPSAWGGVPRTRQPPCLGTPWLYKVREEQASACHAPGSRAQTAAGPKVRLFAVCAPLPLPPLLPLSVVFPGGSGAGAPLLFSAEAGRDRGGGGGRGSQPNKLCWEPGGPFPPGDAAFSVPGGAPAALRVSHAD